MMKKLWLALALGGGMAVAPGAEFQIPREIKAPEWRFQVADDGALRIRVGANDYTWSTRYSYAHMPPDGWLGIPGTPVKVTRSATETTVVMTGKFFTLRREIKARGARLEVRDTVENISGADLAIAFDQRLRSHTPVGAEDIYCAGCLSSQSPATADSPAHNSSIFFQGSGDTLGVILEDDFARLQATIKKSGDTGIFENRSFALPRGGSYSFAYSFYPTASGDYWDFINAVRRDWKLNVELRGNIMLASTPHKALDTGSFPRERFQQYYDNLGVRYVGATNGVWLGSTNFYSVPGSRRFMTAYGSLDAYIKRLGTAMKNAPLIAADFSPFAMIQTIFCAPPQLPGGPIPFADSVIIEADGRPKCRATRENTGSGGKVLGTCYNYYPALDNSYFKHLLALIDRAMDESGIKGIYFDTFTFSYWSKYGRWTYDRWDGHTVDIDLKTWTIARKKADLAILCGDAQLALVDHIRKKGGYVINNHTFMTAKQRTLLPHTISFPEARGAKLAQDRHLSHPTNLGYYPGYNYYGKDGWKDAEMLFDNVMENLNWGCLTYVYWPTSKPITRPTIYKHMYPITPENIYSGCIEGRERIITRHSGTYSFGTANAPTVYCYDAKGVERPPTPQEAVFTHEKGIAKVRLQLPENGAAVIVRNP